MRGRAGWVIAGCLLLAGGPARGDALPYEEDSERAFDAKTVVLGLEAFPDHLVVMYPSVCTRDLDEADMDPDDPARFTVVENGEVLTGPTWDSPNSDVCSFYAIDRRSFPGDALAALTAMTPRQRREFFADDPRAHKAGDPTPYQVVEIGAREFGLKDELRPVMQKDGLGLFPARRVWSLRAGKTRIEKVELPASEPGPPPPRGLEPTDDDDEPAEPETPPAEPATPATPPAEPAPPPTRAAEPPPTPLEVAAPPTATVAPVPPDPFPGRDWLMMVGGFAAFAVVSGLVLLRR